MRSAASVARCPTWSRTNPILQAAAKILNEGKKVAMLVGPGAMEAQDEVLQIAELLGAGVAKSWLGKAVVPEEVPFCTGHIGLLGSKPTWDMMQECDTLLVVGSSFPYAEFYPKAGQAKGVQIDIDGRLLSLRYPMDVNLKGDAKQTLDALMPLIRRKDDRSWQDKIIENVKDWWKVVEGRAHTDGNNGLLNPERVFWELSPKVAGPLHPLRRQRHDGQLVRPRSENPPRHDGQRQRQSRVDGSGRPVCRGRKFCFPDRVCIAVTGDGAMQMNGLNACITVAKYWKEWSDPRWITLVLNNRDLNMVTWEQRIMMGDIRFRRQPGIARFSLCGFRRIDRLARYPRRKARAACRRLGSGPCERSAGCVGSHLRSRYADHPAAYYASNRPSISPKRFCAAIPMKAESSSKRSKAWCKA